MEQLLASSGAAFVTADAEHSQWKIGNDRICKTLAWQGAAGLHLVALEHCTTGHAWRPHLLASDLAGGEFSLCWNDITLSARRAKAPYGARAHVDDSSVTLQIDLCVADVLNVSLCYLLRTDTAVIEQWLVVTPLQAGTLRRVAPLTLRVDSLSTPVLHLSLIHI